MNHAAFSLTYHLILTVKFRHKCINADMLTRLGAIFGKVCADWRCELVELSGERDHVHLLISGHPSMNLARMVGNLKTVSARLIRKEYATHLAKYYWKAKFWNHAYAVVSAGGHANIEQLITYIRDQVRPPT
ncbi:IS200/IS605 family transposase [Caballeronia sp. S22]|uniref:IS200/IS605 family transposase n=1 Tax=Caballeronia sp. S22 TaxID=3137182 RepID=UPI00353179E7